MGLSSRQTSHFTVDRCGKCTRCITACPTSCILPDRTLDARRCISYLTIELKGTIPTEIRTLMDAWIFGCDVCQQVCPWNRFADSEVDPAFDTSLTQPDPDLLDELALTTVEFNHKYRHSPLRRAKRRGYLRNIAIALGNLHSSKAAAPLTQALMFDHEPLVRAHAAWALGQIDGATARQALERAAANENDPLVKAEIQNSLADG